MSANKTAPCPYCNQLFSPRGLARHKAACKQNPDNQQATKGLTGRAPDWKGVWGVIIGIATILGTIFVVFNPFDQSSALQATQVAMGATGNALEREQLEIMAMQYELSRELVGLQAGEDSLGPIATANAIRIAELEAALDELEVELREASESGSAAGVDFELGGEAAGSEYFNFMKQAGMTWLKIDYVWNVNDESLDLLSEQIDIAHQQGLKVLVSVSGELYPSEIEFAEYVEFVGAVAALGPEAIEVWDEMNSSTRWPAGQMNPDTYVESMLAPSFEEIKRIDPEIKVILGSLIPTGVDDGVKMWSDYRYLMGLVGTRATDYADCIGVRYLSGTTTPYAAEGHVAEPSDTGTPFYAWYFPTMVNIYSGLGKPLCFTEVGYAVGSEELPASVMWAEGNTDEEQARWLGEAVVLASQSNVELFFVWNLGASDNTGIAQAWSIVRPDGVCPACEALYNALEFVKR